MVLPRTQGHRLVEFGVLGATVLGTLDGRHVCAAGAFGFREAATDEAVAAGRLIQRPWRWWMLSQFNLGEHFGRAHRVFVAEEIVPLIRAGEPTTQISRSHE